MPMNPILSSFILAGCLYCVDATGTLYCWLDSRWSYVFQINTP